jgi:hypothetical protein
MESENLLATTPNTDNSFYTGKEASTGEIGTSGISRKILHGLTIISVLIACICTIYGSVIDASAVLVLPLIVTLTWLFVHFALLFFSNNDQHDFHPPAWFIFVSSGHIFIQSLVVLILTLYKNST